MTLFVRADASAEIGLGHVMRCLALAEVAVEHGIATCFVGTIEGSLSERLHAGGHRVTSPDGRSWLDQVGDSDAVMYDGYGFGPADHSAAKEVGARVGVIDDRGQGNYLVDVLVHPNLAPNPSFDVSPSTRVLVGPRFALVRREFWTRRRLRDDGERLLVTFGGSDVAGIGQQITTWAHNHAGRWNVRLLLGTSAPDVDVPDSVDVVRAPRDVGAIFDEADVAIAAAGSTTWELCCMGVPTLLVQVAKNQEHVGAPVAELGAAIFLGALPIGEDDVHRGLDQLSDRTVRSSVSRAALALVDGRGCQRVLEALIS